MSKEFFHLFLHGLMITGFVFVMMVVIEYINVQTKGVWQKNISSSKWKQYFVAAMLGAIPGCLGAFTAVAMFSHRVISFGAIVTAMIATSGDEAFVMFARIPKEAFILTGILFVVAIMTGYIIDKFKFSKRISEGFPIQEFPLHGEDHCNCFPKKNLWNQIFHPSVNRLALIVIIASLIIGAATGIIAGNAKNWVKATILIAFSISFFIILTVPEHFLKEHLWNHIVKKHLPRIFLWTFGTLLLLHFLTGMFDFETVVADNVILVLLIAVAIGIIPQSGPHLIFLTMFASGVLPFSILIASSIAQDGHGMLPLLAESKKSFLAVKTINVLVALLVGGVGLLFEGGTVNLIP